MKDIIGVLLVIAFIILLIGLFWLYGKFLCSMMIKAARKKVAQGKLSDKKIIKLYKNTTAQKAVTYLFIGGPLLYPQFKKATAVVHGIYGQELERRNISI